MQRIECHCLIPKRCITHTALACTALSRCTDTNAADQERKLRHVKVMLQTKEQRERHVNNDLNMISLMIASNKPRNKCETFGEAQVAQPQITTLGTNGHDAL
eukprot:189565_1